MSVVRRFGAIGSSITNKASTVTAPSPPSKEARVVGAQSSELGTKTSAPDAAVAAYLPKVVVRNAKVSRSSLDEDTVFGEIKNTGEQSLKQVELTIYCLDANGKEIFEKKTHPVLASELSFGDANQPLKPAYSRQFGVRLNDDHLIGQRRLP